MTRHRASRWRLSPSPNPRLEKPTQLADKRKKRIGVFSVHFQDLACVQASAWYKRTHFDWHKLHTKILPAPHEPPVTDAADISNISNLDLDDNPDVEHYRGNQDVFKTF